MVPRAWRLTLTRTCEVCLNEQTIPPIVGSLTPTPAETVLVCDAPALNMGPEIPLYQR